METNTVVNVEPAASGEDRFDVDDEYGGQRRTGRTRLNGWAVSGSHSGHDPAQRRVWALFYVHSTPRKGPRPRPGPFYVRIPNARRPTPGWAGSGRQSTPRSSPPPRTPEPPPDTQPQLTSARATPPASTNQPQLTSAQATPPASTNPADGDLPRAEGRPTRATPTHRAADRARATHPPPAATLPLRRPASPART